MYDHTLPLPQSLDHLLEFLLLMLIILADNTLRMGLKRCVLGVGGVWSSRWR